MILLYIVVFLTGWIVGTFITYCVSTKGENMEVGDKVEKVKGYRYPGIVVAKFKKVDGVEERLVVECTEPAVYGMLHIFKEDQLRCKNTEQT